MNFDEIFKAFLSSKNHLKMISVASCDQNRPNSAAKMLVDVTAPNKVFYVEYKFTQTYANVQKNHNLSLSFMDDVNFTGYRLNGKGKILHKGVEFNKVKKEWDKRLIRYEADRMLRRITGHHSAREAENALPQDFVIVVFTAEEGSVIKPDRIFRAAHGFAVEDFPAQKRPHP